MSRELFEKRKLEFIGAVVKEKRLPKTWEYSFSDGEDMRVWFDKISKVESFKIFIDKINELLSNFDKKILTDKEKEEEFLNCISLICRIPLKRECYFSDNSDMYMWYMEYKRKNKSFETIVYINLPEYEDFDLATTWPLIKKEFIAVIQTIKKIPEFGKVFLQNGLDVRLICEKLKNYDPNFTEELLLHIETYNKNSLSQEKRIEELKEVIYDEQLKKAFATLKEHVETIIYPYAEKMGNCEVVRLAGDHMIYLQKPEGCSELLKGFVDKLD